MNYRSIQSSIVNVPGLMPKATNKYSDLGKVFGAALSGASVGLQAATSMNNDNNSDILAMKKLDMANNQMDNEAAVRKLRIEETQMNAMTHALEQQKQETLRLQKLGLPALIAQTPENERQNIIKNNPQLLPEVQADVAEYVSKSLADEDATQLGLALANDPNADINALSNQLSSKRQFGDAMSQAHYQLKMEQNKQVILAKHMLDASEGAKTRAIDGVSGEFSTNLAANLTAGTLNAERFSEIVDTMRSKLMRLNPKLSEQDINAAALSELSSFVAGPVGKNLGLDPELALSQINSLSSLAAKFPELQGLAVNLQGDIARGRAVQATQIENDLSDMIQGSDSMPMLDSIQQIMESNVKAGRLPGAAAIKLNGKINDKREGLKLDDDVYKVLGADFGDTKDNSPAALSDNHDASIDRIASKIGLNGSARSVWMVQNFGRLTKNELDSLRNQASIPDPRSLANSFYTFRAINDANPVYARSLTDGKSLPVKLQTLMHLSAFGSQDINLSLSQVASVNDEDLIAARKELVTPDSKGSKKNAAGLRLPDIYAIGEKLGVGDVYDAQIQETYINAVSLYAALIRKNRGIADDKTVFEPADEMAVRFLKNIVSVKKVGGDKYAIFNKRLEQIGFDEGQFENVSTIWNKQRAKLARETGFNSDELMLDFNKAVRENGQLKIPVLLNGVENFAGESLGSFSVPVDAIQLKNQADAINSTSTATPIFHPSIKHKI